jgi:hypothetical protein
MSEYYNAHRVRGLFDPESSTPFRISRAKIDLFLNCSRCFYFDVRCGTARPPSMPFNLNSAVDELLKREFDVHRAEGSAHRLMREHGIDAIPFKHERMDEWREARTAGIRYVDPDTNLLITGGVDDIWINPQGELYIVDYKATSKNDEVSLDAPWQIGYKRQVEIYQWLFRKNGFMVNPIAYFVYCNGRKNAPAFDFKLEFDIKVIPYSGDDSWIPRTLKDIRVCLESDMLPEASSDCDWCNYRDAISTLKVNA